MSLLPEDVDCIVFWSKNPAPILPYLSRLGDYKCGFQFTLNAYDEDIEAFVPPVEKKIDTFRRLSEEFGKQSIIWRYDPIILSKNTDAGFHIRNFEMLAKALEGYTERAVISFVDHYRRIDRFWKEMGIHDPDENELSFICRSISEIASSCGMTPQSCAEMLPLEKYGIKAGACLDAEWISTITGKPWPRAKAKAQRSLCRCMESADIGTYGTCRHGCRYCYAGR